MEKPSIGRLAVFSLRLKEACSEKGITLTELARRTGIPQPSLSRYISGGRDITLRQLGRIAVALGVSVHALIENEDFEEEFVEVMQAMERRSVQEDKAGVLYVLENLQRHYHEVRG